MKKSLGEIAAIVQGIVVGDEAQLISILSPIDNIAQDSIVFAEHEAYLKQAEASTAGAILVAKGVTSTRKSLIQVDNPMQAFMTLLEIWYPVSKPKPGIHPTAVVASDVVMGQDVSIGAYVVIGAGSILGDRVVLESHVQVGEKVRIGNDTHIHPHVTLYNQTILGNRVCIHASSVIGSDGFGYRLIDGKHVKIPHVGNVNIHDDVEIGSHTVIDRAALGETIIGEGTKIDNLVQVAHGVKLGKHNILCSMTGIAGSTVSGDYVVFAANVGVSDHVKIEDRVILGARTGVPPKKHLKEGLVYLGNPSRPRDKAMAQEFAVTRIPILRDHVKSLRDTVAHLTKRLDALEVTPQASLETDE